MVVLLHKKEHGCVSKHGGPKLWHLGLFFMISGCFLWFRSPIVLTHPHMYPGWSLVTFAWRWGKQIPQTIWVKTILFEGSLSFISRMHSSFLSFAVVIDPFWTSFHLIRVLCPKRGRLKSVSSLPPQCKNSIVFGFVIIFTSRRRRYQSIPFIMFIFERFCLFAGPHRFMVPLLSLWLKRDQDPLHWSPLWFISCCTLR